MTFDDPRKDRTPLRLRLYENGFTPLPNHNKACFLPEWSTIKVTPELIQSREWARSRAWADTGLRCGEIIAVDWDVNNTDLINELLDEVVEQGIVKESPFVRVGKPPRELWVYRTSEKIGKRTTGGFSHEPDNPDVKAEQVEVLGGGCQFAAYGWRDEDTQYQWSVESLLDARYMDLPEITLAEVEALKDFAIAFFERKGLQRKSAMAGTDGGYHHVYDLTPDMVFDVQDHGEMSVAEIDGLLRAAPDMVLRCTVEAIRPGTSGSWAGMISLVHGAVCVSDHGSYTSHFPAELDDTKSLAALGKKLDKLIAVFETSQETVPDSPQPLPTVDTIYEELNVKDPFDVNLARALQRYAYSKTDDVFYDLGKPGRTYYAPKSLINFLRPYHVTEKGKNGGETISYLYEAMTMNGSRITAEKAEMRPDRPTPLFEDDDGLVINTYEPLRHNAAGGDATLGHQFLDLLLPDERERHYFKQWLRHKWENPAEPGVGIIMVAQNTFGSGRGTLFEIITRMFGQRYVQAVDFKTLTGKTSQSQYNEWLVDSLIVTVNEASDAGGGSKWQNKAEAYEHVKGIIDPSSRRISVVRKTLRNIQATSFASVIVATNHNDMMVIPANDRRLAILRNGDGAPPEFWVRIRKWLDVQSNISALLADILLTDMEGFSAHAAPPMTLAKADMIETTESDLDRAATDILRNLAAPLLTREQFIMKLEDYAREHNPDFPEGWPRIAEAVFKNRTTRVLSDDRVVVEGKARRVRGVGSVPASLLQNNATVIAAVEMNGPQARAIKSSGTVIGFPQRTA